MSNWTEGRASNPRKKKSSGARRRTGKRKKNPATGAHRVANKRSGRSRGGSTLFSSSPKFMGVNVYEVVAETAMLAGGAYVADQVADFMDDTIFTPMDLDGPILGALGLLGCGVLIFGGHVLGQKLNSPVSISPLVYGATAVLAQRSLDRILGDDDVSAGAETLVDESVVLPSADGTAKGYGYMHGFMPPSSAGIGRMQGMRGEFLLNEQLGISQPDHSHMQAHMHGQYFPSSSAT